MRRLSCKVSASAFRGAGAAIAAASVHLTAVSCRPYATVSPNSSSVAESSASSMSFASPDRFTEQHQVTPGRSEEDVFGHTDPLMAVEQTMRNTDGATSSCTAEKERGNGSHASQELTETPSKDGVLDGKPRKDLATELDTVLSSRNRRRNRRKQSMDAILGDVLHDALRMRDMGEKPSADFVYKRAQERMYEEEYGHKPPTAKENAAKFVPFPPDFHLHRLLPLFGPEQEAMEAAASPSDSDARPTLPPPVYTKNHMNAYTMMPPDPWPERSITPDNPVWTRRLVEEDRQRTGGQGLKEWEARMYAPRPGYDLSGEFVDALDEVAHWELQLLKFVRAVPLSQRRSLPFLHEWYRLLVHRVIRAERRYITVRNALVAQTKASTAVFARTEHIVDAVRGYYAETHRSLSSPNYDPLRMKKSTLAPILRMSDAEFEEWQAVQRQRRNALMAELS